MQSFFLLTREVSINVGFTSKDQYTSVKKHLPSIIYTNKSYTTSQSFVNFTKYTFSNGVHKHVKLSLDSRLLCCETELRIIRHYKNLKNKQVTGLFDR